MLNATKLLSDEVLLKLCERSSSIKSTNTTINCANFTEKLLTPMMEVTQELLNDDVLCKMVFNACISHIEK